MSPGGSKTVAAAAAVLVALWLGGAPEARAEGTAVAVLDLAFEGEIPSWMSARLRARLEQGLAATGLIMMPEERIKAALTGSGGSCATALCRKALGQKLGCDYLVGGLIRGEARSYTFELWIARADSGEVAATLMETCDICGQQKVFTRTELVASQLAARMERGQKTPARVLVQSDPPGARVRVGDEDRGSTPVALSLPPGKHDITLELADHIPAAIQVDAQAGMEVRRRVTLIPAGGSGTTRMLGWAAAGAGVAALAAGIVLMIIDGNGVGCTGDEVTIGATTRPCPERYETMAAGAVLAGLGGVALAGGGTLLYLDRRARSSEARAAAGVRLTGAGLQGRFW